MVPDFLKGQLCASGDQLHGVSKADESKDDKDKDKKGSDKDASKSSDQENKKDSAAKDSAAGGEAMRFSELWAVALLSLVQL